MSSIPYQTVTNTNPQVPKAERSNNTIGSGHVVKAALPRGGIGLRTQLSTKVSYGEHPEVVESFLRDRLHIDPSKQESSLTLPGLGAIWNPADRPTTLAVVVKDQSPDKVLTKKPHKVVKTKEELEEALREDPTKVGLRVMRESGRQKNGFKNFLVRDIFPKKNSKSGFMQEITVMDIPDQKTQPKERVKDLLTCRSSEELLDKVKPTTAEDLQIAEHYKLRTEKERYEVIAKRVRAITGTDWEIRNHRDESRNSNIIKGEDWAVGRNYGNVDIELSPSVRYLKIDGETRKVHGVNVRHGIYLDSKGRSKEFAGMSGNFIPIEALNSYVRELDDTLNTMPRMKYRNVEEGRERGQEVADSLQQLGTEYFDFYNPKLPPVDPKFSKQVKDMGGFGCGRYYHNVDTSRRTSEGLEDFVSVLMEGLPNNKATRSLYDEYIPKDLKDKFDGGVAITATIDVSEDMSKSGFGRFTGKFDSYDFSTMRFSMIGRDGTEYAYPKVPVGDVSRHLRDVLTSPQTYALTAPELTPLTPPDI